MIKEILSALFGLYGTNFNEQRKAYLTMDNITIRNCRDVIAIVEDDTVNNNNKDQLSGQKQKTVQN